MTPTLENSIDSPVVELDRSLRLLANEPRRRIIAELLEQPQHTWIELPETIWTPDLQTTPEKLAIALQHHHLPALTDADYVRWRSQPLEAGRGPKFDLVGELMQIALKNVNDFPSELVQGCYHLTMAAENHEV